MKLFRNGNRPKEMDSFREKLVSIYLDEIKQVV